MLILDSTVSLSTTSIALQSSAPLLAQIPTRTSSQQESTSSASSSDNGADSGTGAIGSPTSTLVPYSTPSASASGTADRSSNNLSSGETAAQKAKSPFIITVSVVFTVFVLCIVMYALMYFMRRRRRRMTAPKAPYMQISEQTALFFSSIKKSGEKLGEVGRDIARKSVFGHGGGTGASRIRDSAMVEQLVPDKPKLPVTYGAVAASRTRRGPPPAPGPPMMQQAGHSPPLRSAPPQLSPASFRQAPRSLFPPRSPIPRTGALHTPRSPLSPPSSARAYIPRISPVGEGRAARPLPPQPIALPPPARTVGLPRSPRIAEHPFADPFVTAEAEARARERGEMMSPDMYVEQRRASVGSIGSVYTDGGAWERCYDFCESQTSISRNVV